MMISFLLLLGASATAATSFFAVTGFAGLAMLLSFIDVDDY
jgi:uncharacterized membrane protein YuzA (DUF378 family)